jgi:hypothetical protein
MPFFTNKKRTEKKTLLGVSEEEQEGIWKKGIEKHLNQISTCNR